MSVTIDDFRDAPRRTGISPLTAPRTTSDRSAAADVAPPPVPLRVHRAVQHEVAGPDAAVADLTAHDFDRHNFARQDFVLADVAPADQPSMLPPDAAGRFDYGSFHEERLQSKQGLSRKLIQGTIILALVGAVGSLLMALPESDDPVVAGNNRVETEDKPVATAEMLEDSALPEIEGSLQLLASSGRLSAAKAARTPSIGSPGDGGDGFATAVAEVVGEIEIAVADAPTTTGRVAPTIPPQSEWVDGGNGVLMPDLLLRIRFCESTNNYRAANSSSSARGAYQFLNGSWDWYGHAARTGVDQAHLATPAQQDEAALHTLEKYGTDPWNESRSCWADPSIDPRYATAQPQPARTTTTKGSSTSATTDPSTTVTTGGSTTSGTGTTVPATGSSTSTAPSSTTTATTATTLPATTTTTGGSSTTVAG